MIAGDQTSAQVADAAIAEALATPGSSPLRLAAQLTAASTDTAWANRPSIKPAPEFVAALAPTAVARRQAAQIGLFDVALEDSWLDLLAHHRIKTARVLAGSPKG
jgi:hypothetical protein